MSDIDEPPTDREVVPEITFHIYVPKGPYEVAYQRMKERAERERSEIRIVIVSLEEKN